MTNDKTAIIDEINNTLAELGDKCVNYLRQIVLEKKEVVFNYDDEEDVYPPMMMYDGGRHPEYATGFEYIDKMYINNNDTLSFAIESTDDYEVQRVNLETLIELCNYFANR